MGRQARIVSQVRENDEKRRGILTFYISFSVIFVENTTNSRSLKWYRKQLQ